jgi:hypothetical protein
MMVRVSVLRVGVLMVKRKEKGFKRSAGTLLSWIIPLAITICLVTVVVLLTLLFDQFGVFGQILKFFIFKILLEKCLILFTFVGLVFTIYGLFTCIKKKSGWSIYWKFILVTPILIAILFFYSYYMGFKPEQDLLSYLRGDVVVEDVTIVDYEHKRRKGEPYVTYWFSDGREFTEWFRGKDFLMISKGDNYRLTYLSRTHKLLKIEHIE